MLNLKENKSVKNALVVLGAASVLAGGFVFGINYGKKEEYVNNVYDNSITYERLLEQAIDCNETDEPCKFTGEVLYYYRRSEASEQMVELVLSIEENKDLVVVYDVAYVDPDIKVGDIVTISGDAKGCWDLAGDASDNYFPCMEGKIFE